MCTIISGISLLSKKELPVCVLHMLSAHFHTNSHRKIPRGLTFVVDLSKMCSHLKWGNCSVAHEQTHTDSREVHEYWLKHEISSKTNTSNSRPLNLHPTVWKGTVCDYVQATVDQWMCTKHAVTLCRASSWWILLYCISVTRVNIWNMQRTWRDKKLLPHNVHMYVWPHWWPSGISYWMWRLTFNHLEATGKRPGLIGSAPRTSKFCVCCLRLGGIASLTCNA